MQVYNTSEVIVPFATELAKLESLGFTKKSQNLALLRKTNGNVDVVARFLSARNDFREAASDSKSSKKLLKKELKHLKNHSSGDSSDDEVKDEIKALKKEKKRLKKEIKSSEKQEKDEKKILKIYKAQAKADSEHFDDKALKKSQKKIEKEAKKLEKQEKKALKKQEKELEKVHKKKDSENFKQLPSEIHTVYLDGNNMLFVLGALRTRVLHKNMNEAEHILELMAKTWQRATPQLQACTLIFDDTKTYKVDGAFQVCSARPTFPTSDHALVHWAQGIAISERAKVAVFTSDRALSETLRSIGVQVFKSKMWFNVAANALRVVDQNEDSIPDLDVWADVWLSQNFQEMMNVNNNN